MLTIHVGLHKTGSTAFQRYLSSRPQEPGNGLLYLEARSDRFLGNDGFDFPTSSEQWRALTGEALATFRDVVVSHEGILGTPWGESEMFVGAIERGKAISEAFTGLTDFQLVVYLRPQYQWFESAYTQMVQQGSCIPPETFVASHIGAKYVRYTQLVDDLISVVGAERLVFRAYRENQSVVEDFLAIVEWPATPGTQSTHRENVSISPAQVEILRRMNKYSECSSADQLGRRFFQDISVGNHDGSLSVLPEHLQNQLIELTKEDWKLLSTAVEPTRFANPTAFLDIARDANTASVRPYIGAPEHREQIISEVIRALSVAMSNSLVSQQQPKELPEAHSIPPSRQSVRYRLANAIRTRLRFNPVD